MTAIIQLCTYIIMQCMNILYSLCAAAILITGFIDNTALFCSARDLVDATKKGNETVFCTISGRND